MDKYICTVCDYVYDPELGDPENGIEPGTSFEDLPEDWVCPLCGVGKEEFEKIKAEIAVMNKEYKLKKEGYKTLLTSKFMELLVTISRIYRLNSDENEKKILSLKFGEVITWIEKNFRQGLSVEELSKKAGYSQRHFLRIFKETYHMTPTEYINAIRIEYACSRLRETEESVTDIAYDCGFRNMSYFYRVFKEKMSMTPQKYRKSI